MKQYPVEYGAFAKEDIDDVFVYVLSESQDFTTARQYTERLYAKCEKIGNAPQSGVSRDDLGEGIRMVPFEKAGVILYQTEDDAVWIVRVFLGGRDYHAIMQGYDV